MPKNHHHSSSNNSLRVANFLFHFKLLQLNIVKIEGCSTVLSKDYHYQNFKKEVTILMFIITVIIFMFTVFSYCLPTFPVISD